MRRLSDDRRHWRALDVSLHIICMRGCMHVTLQACRTMDNIPGMQALESEATAMR